VVSLSYDADGNLLSDGVWHYVWDAENRLVQASNAATRLDFAYDHMGRRMRKQSWAWQTDHWSLITEHAFLYDGWNLIREVGSQGTVFSTNDYVWGLDISGTLHGAAGVGGLILLLTPDSCPLIPVFDGSANVIALADSSNPTNLLARYEYGPFGEVLRADGPAAAGNPFRFSTRYTDPETALVMYPMRPYSPTLGRFLSRDPIGEMEGEHAIGNLYPYCDNDPVNYVDPDGQRKGPPFHRKNQRRERQSDIGLVTGVRALLGTVGSVVDLDMFRSRGRLTFDPGADQHCQFLLTVNGIWNSRQGAEDLLRDWRADFSDLGSIPNIGYVHNPTTYLTDFIQIGFLELGAIGIPSQTTAEYIRRAYDQAKKDCCKCTDIYVIAHSQGAAILNQALPLLSPDIKKTLRILTIGAEQYVRGGSPEFGFVANVNSGGDRVPDLSPRNRFYNEIQVPRSDVPGHPHAYYRQYFQQEGVGLPQGFIVPPDRAECR
jgi:RHS repeat-associated protein